MLRRDAEAAIAVAVPVDADVGAELGDERLHERRRPPWRRSASRGRPCRRCRAAFAPARMRRREEQRAAIRGSARVVSSVTYITVRPSFTAKRSRVLGALAQVVERPAFRVLADRARADERAALDRHAGPLRDLDDRLDVGDDGARGAVGADLQPLVADRARQALDVRGDCGPAPGRPMSAVSMPSASMWCRMSIFSSMRRRAHRRRLQAVAQRLVVEHRDADAGRPRRGSSRRSADAVRCAHGSAPSATCGDARSSRRGRRRESTRRGARRHPQAACDGRAHPVVDAHVTRPPALTRRAPPHACTRGRRPRSRGRTPRSRRPRPRRSRAPRAMRDGARRLPEHRSDRRPAARTPSASCQGERERSASPSLAMRRQSRRGRQATAQS